LEILFRINFREDKVALDVELDSAMSLAIVDETNYILIAVKLYLLAIYHLVV